MKFTKVKLHARVSSSERQELGKEQSPFPASLDIRSSSPLLTCSQTTLGLGEMLEQVFFRPSVRLYGGWLGLRALNSFRTGWDYLRVHPKSLIRIERNAQVKLEGPLWIGYSADETSPLPRYSHSGLVIKSDGVFSSGDHCTLLGGAHVHVSQGASVRIGAYTHLGYCTQVVSRKEIVIGDYCAISWGVSILDSDLHTIENRNASDPVHIGDRVLIGHRVSILPGVTIGSGSIVGAGSVVTKNIPDNCLAVGNPAKVIQTGVKWS